METQSANSHEVGLVAVTPNAESIIAFCARVSNPQNQDKPADKLLKYLIENKHWSPFEMANMVILIKTSRAISAQILRHRSFSFQEFSQRYAAVQEFVTYHPRRQDDKNRQSSIDDLSEYSKNWFKDAQDDIQNFAALKYKDALDIGIAKECARFLLPMSSATSLYMNGSIRSWIHYIQLRTDDSTQFEHRAIASDIKEVFESQFPTIAEALNWQQQNQ